MTWQRGVQLVVVSIGLTTALAVVLLMRERPTRHDPGLTATVDPGATIQAGSGVDTRHRGNERVGVMAYDEQTSFKDGRIGYKNARLTLNDGTVLSAGYAETLGKAATADSPAAEFRLRNGVQLKTTAGATLAGESGVYNDARGEASIPGAVTFARGRVSGRGMGAEYKRDGDILTVLADVVVTLQADPPGQPVEVTAATMTFTAATRSMLFDRNARITRASEVLSGDAAVLFLSDNDDHFRAIHLRGHAAVVPAAGATNGLAEMRAADIDLTFHEGGQALRQAALNGQARLVQPVAQGGQTIDAPRIDLTLAPDGQTLTDLRGGPTAVTVRLPSVNGAPARTIEADTLAATGTDTSGLLKAVFTGPVRFTEDVPAAAGRAASAREGRARWLSLDLAGKLNALEAATFRQDVRFVAKSAGKDTTGDADVGVYDAASGRLELTPAVTKVMRPPRVTDGDITVDATARIVVDLNTNSLEARENVKTSSTGSGPGRARGFFTPGAPVRGSGAVFTRDSATQSVKYTGRATEPAWVQQGTGDSRIEASEIVMFEGTGDLRAAGRVRSAVLFDSAPVAPATKGTPVRYDITADTMAYDEQARTATYAGAPVVLQRPNGETRSRRLVITLARDERRLERLVASEAVTARLEGDREAKGSELTYDAAADRYSIRGAPVLVRSRDRAGACTLSQGQFVQFTGTGEGHEWPLAQNTGGNVSGPFSCTEPLP